MRTEDLSAILDGANPTSTGCPKKAQDLYDVIKINFFPVFPSAVYFRGWGYNSSDPAPIICSLSLTFQNMESNPFIFVFNLTDDNAPLNIILSLPCFSNCNFLSTNPTVTFLQMDISYTFSMYINYKGLLNCRAHLDIIGHKPTTSGLMSMQFGTKYRASKLPNCMHMFTHTSVYKMTEVLTRVDHVNDAAKSVSTKVKNSCDVCA